MDNDIIEPQADWLTERDIITLEYEAGMIKTSEDLKEKRLRETKLLVDFKKNPSQETFMPLYTSYKPLIYQAAKKNMFGSPIPQAAHMAYAAQSFLDATRTFDASKGSQFTTHMFNTVQEKGKRLNLKYQNIGYIPESRATKYQAFQTANHILKEQLGREPTTIELADELGIPEKEIERLRIEIRKDLIAKEHFVQKGMAFAQSDKAMQVARDILPSLEPKHQLVLEYTLGLNGRPSLAKKSGKSDIIAIAAAAKIGVNDVRSARKTIFRKYKEYTQFMGKDDNVQGLFEDEAEE